MWAKTKRKKKFKHAFGRKAEEYGALTSTDRVYMRDVYKEKGVDGNTDLLTFVDRCTNFRMCMPAASKDTPTTKDGLRFLRGKDEWKWMYSDNWKNIKESCANMHVLW